MKFFLAALILMSVGCVKTVTVVPTDANGEPVDSARIEVNGTPIGQGTTNVRVDNPLNVNVNGEPRYYSESFTIGPQTPSPLRVMLKEDEIYASTVEDTNAIVSKWLTLNIGDDAKENDQWWTIVVNAIATQDFEMELMDQKSGFIRTAWKERKFGDRGVRRRFTGNSVSTDPLQWRIKYSVEITSNGQDWVEYDRGFKDELDAIEEIRGRTQK